MTSKSAMREKLMLIGASVICICALTAIAMVALAKAQAVNSESATLVGVIVTALATYSKDSVQAVRSFWQDDRMGKMTDQIASSIPTAESITPPPAEPAVPIPPVPGEPS